MPITVQRYLCSACKNEYRTFQEAMDCESRPVPFNPYPEGSVVNYEDESTMFGTRYSYTTDSGIVLYSWLGYNLKTKEHVWSWIVQSSNGHSEVLVQYINDEFGMTRLISLAEDKYQIGYADLVRSRHVNY